MNTQDTNNESTEIVSEDPSTASLTDLDISDEQSGDVVGGGMLLPAVQKVREAAAR